MPRVLLSAFFENVFLPLKLPSQTNSKTHAAEYRAALVWLAKSLRREPWVEDLTAEHVRGALDTAAAAAVGAAERRLIRNRIGRVWLYAFQLKLVRTYEPIAIVAAAGELRASRREPPAPAEAGTLRHFFETVHRPQRLFGCHPTTLCTYRITLDRLREHFGRDIRVEEQTDALAADHFQWLLASGIRPVSINNCHRANWFALWRHAIEKGLIQHEPKVKKLPVETDEPDAWSEDEARRIIDATTALRDWPPIAGIRADKYLRAFLLVGWWTGLRRSSLFRLSRSDVSLSTAELNVGGSKVKNKRGRRYVLPPDAIDALKEIWRPEREKLFPWPTDAAADPIGAASRRFYLYLNEVLRVAGVPPSTRRSMNKLHKWRRTVGTHAAINGGVEAAISILNHSGPDVVKRYLDPTKLPNGNPARFLPSLTSPRKQSAG